MEKPRNKKSVRRVLEVNDTPEDEMDRQMAELIEEPVDYLDNVATPTTPPNEAATHQAIMAAPPLSAEVIQSLQSVKHVCLIALDSLLHQMVSDLPVTTNAREVRRLSDSMLQCCQGDILGSITDYATRLSRATTGEDTDIPILKRSKSSPALATMDDVQRLLDSHQLWMDDVGGDYHLCCALAALLHDVYRILELSASNDETDAAVATPLSPTDPSSVYNQLHEQVSTFRRERAAGRMIIESDASKELTILWNEVDRLMEAVCHLASDRPSNQTTLSILPPMYNDHELYDPKEKPPPQYEEISAAPIPTFSSSNQSEKAQRDLDSLLSAIDRLSNITPQLNNQRVGMTERQAKELAAATVTKAIERLSRGRLENQRAMLPLALKHDMLRNLVAQICRSASRTLDNQRVSVSGRLQNKMDVAALHDVLDRFDRGRLTDQEWVSPEEALLKELTTMTDLLARSLQRPSFGRQRYYMSSSKERGIFFNNLLDRVDHMESRRMCNQDANEPTALRSQRLSKPPPAPVAAAAEPDDELNFLFDHIHKAKSQLDNQRASFSNTTSFSF